MAMARVFSPVRRYDDDDDDDDDDGDGDGDDGDDGDSDEVRGATGMVIRRYRMP